MKSLKSKAASELAFVERSGSGKGFVLKPGEKFEMDSETVRKAQEHILLL